MVSIIIFEPNLILEFRQFNQAKQLIQCVGTESSLSVQMSTDPFFLKVIEIAKDIILESKKLIGLITNSDEDAENEELAATVSEVSQETGNTK